MLTKELIGHFLGAAAVVLFFLSYQVRSKKPLLVLQTAATTLYCLQYLLIGAYSGFALNIICVTRNLAFSYKDHKKITGPWIPIVFACLYPIMILFSWEGLHSIILVVALMINTLFLGLSSPQGIRKSILLTSAMVLLYNALVLSYAGVINETLTLISAILGIIRYRKKETIPDAASH